MTDPRKDPHNPAEQEEAYKPNPQATLLTLSMAYEKAHDLREQSYVTSGEEMKMGHYTRSYRDCAYEAAKSYGIEHSTTMIVGMMLHSSNDSHDWAKENIEAAEAADSPEPDTADARVDELVADA